MKTVFGKRFLWLVLSFVCALIYVLCSHGTKKESYTEIIRSDGSGYYAYLPAFFIHHDASFQKSSAAEKKIAPWKNTDLYLYPTENGKTYNKYFPGLALMQLPFFGLAYGLSVLFGQEVSGYECWFQFFFLVGSYTFFFLAVWLTYLYLYKYKEFSIPSSIVGTFLIYAATTMLFYSTTTPSFSHHYSYFLFLLFLIFVEEWWKGKQKYGVYIALVLGLIFLVRPTNVLIVFLLPYLLGGWGTCVAFLANYFRSHSRKAIVSLVAFSSFIVLALLINHWQLGTWWNWSYKGEGFFWTSPQLWETFVGFRTGYLIHHPIFLISLLLGIGLVVKGNRNMLYWLGFVLLNGYVVSIWWCWDYETFYGHRAMTEYSLVYLLPLISFFQQPVKARMRLLLMVLLFVCVSLSFFRSYQFHSGILSVQRFTARSYFNSLGAFGKESVGRFQFAESCPPFGECQKTIELLQEEKEKEITRDIEFSHTSEIRLGPKKANQRAYFDVQLDKWSQDDLRDVYLVIDATGDHPDHRYYWSCALYNDAEVEKGTWTSLNIQTTIHDNYSRFSKYKVYLWNKGKKNFKLRSLKYELKVFGVE